ncbi:glycosyltransferase family 4 protein [uncultured Desulfobacter sp.]|uniref:glycosyltransferase family 4 protein n=1 Tax=uncultured Desulfobacter sp. TaxID=240139 RepID=UPI002AABFDFF|nr:glycosyltransferase family 4 protein [uncultured Desulfobacter sp.]
MPSLRETLTGHTRENCTIEVILPRYDLFSDDLSPVSTQQTDAYKVHVALCRWLPVIKAFRNRIGQVFGRNTIPYPIRWMTNVLMLFLLTISLVKTGKKVCGQGEFFPNLVYAHNQYAALAGFILGKILKVPNTTRLYGTFLADLMKKPFIFLRYPTAAAGYLIPSNLLICANDGTRGDEVAKKFGIPNHRFRFWQNGIDPPSEKPVTTRQDLVNRFGPKLRMESIWAISCSRLSNWKRIDRMLHAIDFCKSQKVDCQLIVAGDGPEKENLERLAITLGIEDRVIWMGAVGHDDIWELMNVADIFMITNNVTNRCNPLFEATWANLPVISVKDPSTSDLLNDKGNALLSDKNDGEQLGQNLAILCKNMGLMEKMKVEQKKMADSFWTWEERMRTEVVELEKLIISSGK